MTARRDLPVVIVGGGPAGSVCARQLALHGHAVVLLERESGEGPRFGETCGPRLLRFLQERCGLSLPGELFAPLERFHSAWGSDELDCRNHRLWSAGHGAILDRTLFDAWLRAEAQRAGAEINCGTTMTGGEWRGDRWTLRCRDAAATRSVEAAFVVEATGRAASLGLFPDATRLYADRLVSAVAEIAGSSPIPISALVESAPTGWWYGAELPTGRRVVAYFTDADLLATGSNVMARIDETKHLRQFAPELDERSSFRITAARTSIRRLLWRGAWLAIGDAACSLDPLSGAGIERSVRDGFEAAEALHTFVAESTSEPLRNFAVARTKTFRDGLALRQKNYSYEKRWSDAPFWHRRSGQKAN